MCMYTVAVGLTVVLACAYVKRGHIVVRATVNVMCLLPLTFLWWLYCEASWRWKSIFDKASAGAGEHVRRVRQVQDQVLQWNSGNKSTRMCTSRSGVLTFSN